MPPPERRQPPSPARSYTRAGAAAKKKAASAPKGAPKASPKRTAAPAERRAPKPPAAKTAAASTAPASAPQKGDSGGLQSEILAPLALGQLVVLATLGIIVLAGAAPGGAIVIALIATAVGMSGALIWWVAMLLRTSAARPLAEVRVALQQMEEGDYETRLKPEGARELREVAVGFNRMITIVGHQRERLKLLAATDSLTGLVNHRHLHELLRADIAHAREEDTPLAIVALDIDGFKALNDMHGHARGDEALRSVAAALEKAVREQDTVARPSGDDFVLVLRGATPGHARELAERARAALARCLPEEPHLTASAGFVCFPEQGGEESNLAELAAFALDVAKRAGGDQTRKYDPDQAAAIPTIKQQRAEIDALLAGEAPIKPVFQPLVELATGRLVGYEALSRFNSELSRPPDAWFNQAQQCGRGTQLEAAAIEAALSAPYRPPGTYLSLNFSPSALGSRQLLKLLPDQLEDVVIEVTEHELAAQDGAVEDGLAQLRERGARIAVDDVGAGYAGLNQVMRIQPNLIKLDRSLIEGVHQDSAKSALIEFFVLFARRVGAAVCTEGIETLDELGALINLGVTYGQGYLLGRPADPWSSISPEIARTLATGALRVHAASAPQPDRAPARGARESMPVGGPVNRRLSRYRSR